MQGTSPWEGLLVTTMMALEEANSGVVSASDSHGGGGVVAAAAVAAAWRGECLLLVATALLPRITDKIANIQSAAISPFTSLLQLSSSSEGASKSFFGDGNDEGGDEGSELLPEQVGTATSRIRSSLLWIMANESPASNCASVASIILPPLSNKSSPAEEDEDEIDVVVQSIISRTGTWTSGSGRRGWVR